MIKKVEELLKNIAELSHKALTSYVKYQDFEWELMQLGLLEIEQYRIYKRAYHTLEKEKDAKFLVERKNHSSDQATSKAVNKIFIVEGTAVEQEEDLLGLIERYYKKYSRFGDRVNSSYIKEMSENKRQQSFT